MCHKYSFQQICGSGIGTGQEYAVRHISEYSATLLQLSIIVSL
jgi:hypothetical protein